MVRVRIPSDTPLQSGLEVVPAQSHKLFDECSTHSSAPKMKIWKDKVKIDGKIYTVKEHTDKECEKPRSDGKYLAPISHGFVCLYQDVYEKWCGVDYAKKRIIK